MRYISKKIIFGVLVIFLIFVFSAYLWQGIFLPKDFSKTESVLFLVKKGENVFKIGENLEKEGLIKNKFLFDLYVLVKGASRKLQAGQYSLSPSMSIAEIAKKIISGEIVKTKITIIEGWTVMDIFDYLEKKGIIERGRYFYGLDSPLGSIDFSKEFEFLRDRPKTAKWDTSLTNLEGFLFPDTYLISYGMSIEDILRMMLENFDKKLTKEIREEIKRQRKTIFEIVTMASLIEKEVYNTPQCPDCKNLVSGILWKRLKNKIPLQVDATINYITGKKTIKISIEDTQIDSPYNTYKYLGLPPGPICNPGLESILAALYPKESDYWYYLSTPEGETIFSKTLEEHNIKKAKYLR